MFAFYELAILWAMLLPSQVDGSLQEWCEEHAIPVGLWSDLA